VELSDARPLSGTYRVCRDRLRQLKSSTNRRLLNLGFRWRIKCPRNNFLQLTIQS
jgi:hypothetical protein